MISYELAKNMTITCITKDCPGKVKLEVNNLVFVEGGKLYMCGRCEICGQGYKKLLPPDIEVK